MDLSNDLLMQFAKVTKSEETTKKETTVYGTAVKYNGATYVRFDGSELLTPVITTADVDDNERVSILLKDHTATITGNLSAPSARNKTVSEVRTNVTKVEEVVADTVRTDQLKAESARIDALETKTAKIDTLEADNVTINNRLTATEAVIKDLTGGSIDVENLTATFATVESLNVERGRIDTLESGVADIDTLIFGSATGTVIQTSFANSVIAQLGDAQIKSAMIQDVSASKITAGDIITNNVRVKSQDGSLIISDETMQISDGSRVRVQIGKDASNDYSINVWDASGNLMFSKGGITDSAIKNAIIRNDMVSDTANIAAHKLDIDSLFEEINGSTNTIKSTKVYLDDKKQTLAVAFKSLDTTVTNQGKTITSQGTQITAIQGQLESKIWQQDIDTAKNELSTQYSTLTQDVYGIYTTVQDHTSQLNDLEIGGRNLIRNSSFANGTSKWSINNSNAISVVSGYSGNGLQTVINTPTSVAPRQGLTMTIKAGDTLTGSAKVKVVSGDFSEYSMRFAGAFTLPLVETKPLKDDWTLYIYRATAESDISITPSQVFGFAYGEAGTYIIDDIKLERGNQATDWTPAPEDIDDKFTSTETSINQLSNKITANVTETTNLGTRMTTVEQTSSELSVRLNDMVIGGRNLALDSGKEVSFANTTKIYNLSSYAADIPASTKMVISFECYTDEPGAGFDYYLRYVIDGAGKAVGITPVKSVTGSYKKYYAVVNADYDAPPMVAIRASQYTTGTYSETATFYVRNMKVEVGNVPTDWSPAPEDVDGDILDASKSATDYLKFGSSGLVVGDMTASSLGKNVLIDSNAVKIRTGSTVHSVFGPDIIELAKDNESATISMLNGAFKIYYDADNSDGGFGIYGVTSAGAERLAFQAVNENDNLTIGWGGYAASANLTNIYGNGIRLYAKDGIKIQPGSGKTLEIDGRAYGVNQVLWSGGRFMTADHTATLSAAVSAQPHGIVLVFSQYTNGAAADQSFHEYFVPKTSVAKHGGKGHVIHMSTSNLDLYATKYLYISDTKITGHANNGLSGTGDSGITYSNDSFVLRYVIGV